VSNIKKNAAYNIVLSATQVLFPVLVFPYVSRVLGPKGMGSIGFVENFTHYFIVLAALGIPVYGVQEIAKHKQDDMARSAVFSEIIIIHSITTLILSIVFVFLFMTVGQLYEYRPLFIISVGIMYVQVFTMEWLFQGMEQFKLITVRGILTKVVAIFFIYIFVKNEQDTIAYYAIIFLTALISMLFNMYYAWGIVKLKVVNLNLFRHLKPMLYILSFSLVIQVYTVLDTTILGFLKDDVEVGYYTTSTKVSRVLITVLTAVTMVMIPPIAKNFHEKRLERNKQLLTESFSYVSLLSIPLVVGLMLYAEEIVRLFAGDEFLPATHSLQIIAPTIIIIGYSNIFGMQILNPSNNERLFFRAACVGMIASLTVNFIFIPQFGYIGASIAAFVAELVVLVFLIRFSLRIIDFNPDWRLPFKALLSSLIFIPVYYFVGSFELNTIVTLSFGVLLSTLLYFSVQYWGWRNILVTKGLNVIFRFIRRN